MTMSVLPPGKPPQRQGLPRRELKVVDLSERPAALTPLHEEILAALDRGLTGILSRDELLQQTAGHPPSEVERALRDLSLRGDVKVLWPSPFRFLAFATGVRASTRGAPRAAVAV